MVSSNTLMLLVALTLAAVSSMGVHDPSTARMLAGSSITVNGTAYEWLTRNLNSGGLFAAWVGWVCFIEWGVVHLIAGFMTIRGALADDVSTVMTGIMSRLSPADKTAMDSQRKHNWPKQTNRIMLHHGLNLGWIGLWSLSMCWFIHYPPKVVFWLSMPILLVDFGYWVAIDTSGLGGCLGEVQTYIASIGVLCAAIVAKNTYGEAQFKMYSMDAEFGVSVFFPVLLIFMAFITKLMGIVKMRRGNPTHPKAKPDPREMDL